MIITIVIAVYNNKHGLEKSIKSFINQSLFEKELIVIDGGSQDGTVHIINKYANQISYWESKRDRGIYHAWNKALRKSKGDWYCFLGAGDYLWHKDVLRDVSNVIVDNPAFKILYGKIASIRDNGNINSFLGEPWTQRNIGMHRIPPHGGIFHSVDLFNTYGPFDETFKIAADYDFTLRVLKDNYPLFMPGIIVAGVQDGGVSTRLGTYLRLFFEDIKARRKNSMCIMSASLAFYYFKRLAYISKRDIKDRIINFYSNIAKY